MIREMGVVGSNPYTGGRRLRDFGNGGDCWIVVASDSWVRMRRGDATIKKKPARGGNTSKDGWRIVATVTDRIERPATVTGMADAARQRARGCAARFEPVHGRTKALGLRELRRLLGCRGFGELGSIP